MLEGYDQEREDVLLAESGWERDGYNLFEVSSLASSSQMGWFRPAAESNCLTVTRAHFDDLHGFDEAFSSPGGGLVNLDFYKRACESPGAFPIVLVGEGTFHQFHGGVATNVPRAQHPFELFQQEYLRLRGTRYRPPTAPKLLLGHAPRQVIPWLVQSASSALDGAPIVPGGPASALET